MSAHFFKEYVNEATGLRFNERLQYSAVCTNLRWFLLSWYLTLCQIFCCCIIQGVGFNYHQRNVRSRISVSNFQVSVSEVTVSTTWLPCSFQLVKRLIKFTHPWGQFIDVFNFAPFSLVQSKKIQLSCGCNFNSSFTSSVKKDVLKLETP